MSLNRYLKSHTLQFYSVYQSDTAFLIIHRKEDREQLKGSTGNDKLANLIFHPEYIQGKDIILVDDIATTGQSFIQMKRKCMRLGANSVVGVFLGKTI